MGLKLSNCQWRSEIVSTTVTADGLAFSVDILISDVESGVIWLNLATTLLTLTNNGLGRRLVLGEYSEDLLSHGCKSRCE